MRVLIACEYSGTVRDAFLARGHDAISCDLLPTDQPGPHYQGDIFDFLEKDSNFDLMIAHPVCTRLANSGVRWLSSPPKGKTIEQMQIELKAAADFYIRLRDVNISKKAIENPVMHKYARELINPAPRQVVQPWWFGDEAFKATGFELINLPELIPTDKLNPPTPGSEDHKKWSFIHRASPSPERWKLRSKTFPGLANAMADQWGGSCQ